MKIYIACASKKKTFAKKLAEEFEKNKFEIVCKWWEWEVDYLGHYDYMRLLRSIEVCDVVVAMSDCFSYGVAFEIGYATALGKPVYSSGHINIDSYSEMFYLVEHIKGYKNLLNRLKLE